MDLYELHQKMTAHLFPTYSSTDERFLALALCGVDEIADIRVYLELLAKCFGIEGSKLDERVKQKLEKVVEKHKARLG